VAHVSAGFFGSILDYRWREENAWEGREGIILLHSFFATEFLQLNFAKLQVKFPYEDSLFQVYCTTENLQIKKGHGILHIA
jgi:hypothetical protein